MERRRQKLLDYLQREGRTSVNVLANIFDTSGATIRSDLRAMEHEGLVVRRYGSAEACGPTPSLVYGGEDRSMDEKQALNLDLKRRIARKAVELVGDGQSIILDGSTALQMVPYLEFKRELTVMSNSMHIVNALAKLETEHTIVISGGTYRRKSASFHGSMAEDAFSKYTFDCLFIGASGFDLSIGTTTYNEAYHVSREMQKAAKKTIVVLDSSKFGRRGPNVVLPIDHIDIMITDSGISDDYLSALRDKGIKVYVV